MKMKLVGWPPMHAHVVAFSLLSSFEEHCLTCAPVYVNLQQISQKHILLIVRVVSANHPIKVRKKKDMMEARFDRQHVVKWKEFIVRRCAPSADGRTADKR